MKSNNLLNAFALVIALSLALFLSGVFSEVSWQSTHVQRSNSPQEEKLKNLVDATGVSIPIRNYQRIASGSMVVDRLLLELAHPNQILSYSGFTKEAPWAYRMGSKPHLDSLEDTEKLITLEPDLFVVHHSMSILQLKQLRESGIIMFDLGPFGGFDALLEDIHLFAKLIGHPERGETFAKKLTYRMDAIRNKAKHRNLSNAQKLGALYLTHYGKDLYGGTTGSSLHDVIEYAGLRDIAADTFTGWPRYTAEQILELNPDWIITQTGMKIPICNVPGLQTLQACKNPKRIIEIDAITLTSPGPSMVTATETLYEKVFGNNKQ